MMLVNPLTFKFMLTTARSLLSTLGLTPTAEGIQPSNHAAGYIIANFTLGYLLVNSRILKNHFGLDHNVSPRQNIADRGVRMVSDGKITQRALNLIKRVEGAHANSMEHFTLFVGTMLFTLQAKMPASTVNMVGAAYTLARCCYVAAYVGIESEKASYLRSLAWWASNIICLRTLALCGKAINV